MHRYGRGVTICVTGVGSYVFSIVFPMTTHCPLPKVALISTRVSHGEGTLNKRPPIARIISFEIRIGIDATTASSAAWCAVGQGGFKSIGRSDRSNFLSIFCCLYDTEYVKFFVGKVG